MNTRLTARAMNTRSGGQMQYAKVINLSLFRAHRAHRPHRPYRPHRPKPNPDIM